MATYQVYHLIQVCHEQCENNWINKPNADSEIMDITIVVHDSGHNVALVDVLLLCSMKEM